MLNSQDEYWMRQAIELANAATAMDEVPVGAVVVQNEQMIGAGANRTIVDHDPSAHAEIIALRSAAAHVQNYRLPGASLYVTLEPCAMCAGAIIQARIEKVIFGASDPKAGAAGSVFNVLATPQLNHQCEVIGGVLETQCMHLIQAFFQVRRMKSKQSKIQCD